MKEYIVVVFFLSCVKWHALSPPSGCRLPGEAWPAERGRGQEEVLADPVGGGVLSQPQHRPQGPQGRESAVGWTHEHQDCRYCSNVALRDTSSHLFKLSFWKRLVLISWLPWSQYFLWFRNVLTTCRGRLHSVEKWSRGCLRGNRWLKDASEDTAARIQRLLPPSF